MPEKGTLGTASFQMLSACLTGEDDRLIKALSAFRYDLSPNDSTLCELSYGMTKGLRKAFCHNQIIKAYFYYVNSF